MILHCCTLAGAKAQLLAVTRFTRLHGYEATGNIRDSNDTIHGLLCSVRMDYATGIVLGFLQCLLVENVGGTLEPIGHRGNPPNLQSVSSEKSRFNGSRETYTLGALLHVLLKALLVEHVRG